MKPGGGFRSVEPKVPTLDEITELYQRAVDAGDPELRASAQRAVNQLAAAEAAVVEAATLVDFGQRIRG
jgi:hypothetical protein